MTAQLRAVSAGDRIPPQNLDAEKSVLGAVLIKPDCIGELLAMATDDFYLPAHREIFEALIALHERDAVLDVIALADELKARGALSRLEGREGYLMDLASSVPTAENVATYVRLVREKSALRKLIAYFGEGMSLAYGESSFAEIIADVRDKVLRLESTGTISRAVKIGDAMGHVLSVIEERAKSPSAHAVLSGIHRFDSLTGGLREGKLIIVAARPGMGKTAWAGTVCTNAAMKYGVPAFIASVEMQRDELIERMLASEGSISTEEISSGRVAKSDQGAHLMHAAQRLSKIPLWVDDRGDVTAGHICGAIRRWYSEHVGRVPGPDEPPKLAIAAVDYLQILEEDQSDERHTRRDLALGKMTRALKQLAKALRIPVVLLSQLNRKMTEGGGRRPQLSDLRESGAIEQDADIVVFPHRILPDDEAEAARMRNQPGDMEWVIGKNRGGRTGIVDVHWQPAFTRFENRIADTEYPQNWQDGRQED